MPRVLNERYRLEEVIGSGATATIWRAWDTRLERSVAVKLLDRPGLGIDHDEARTLAQLSHPGIVAIFDSGADGGDEYLVMELVEGSSARSRLADGVFAIDEAAAVVAQICDALAAAHTAGIVHRDIKPGNILIGPGRTVKVCDFGIARRLDTTSHTARGIALGTAAYMSPEQVEGHPIDGRTDLYAVGCVLFQMLTGRVPFVGDDSLSVAHQQVHKAPPTVRSLRPQVPPDLDRLVGRLLAKAPDDRPATAAQVRTELRAWADPAAVAVAPRRRPYARLGLVTVAALALPAALLTSWPHPDRNPSPAGIATAGPGISPSANAPRKVPPESVASPRPPVHGPASPVRIGPSRSPRPSPSPAPVAMPEQIAQLQALIRQLADTGQLPQSNADDLVHNLDDLEHTIAAGKQPEARDKLAAIRKKNDDLLAAGKISLTGHAQIGTRLDSLAIAIAAMSPSPTTRQP